MKNRNKTTFVDYYSYIKSPFWRNKRTSFFKSAGKRCQLTGILLNQKYHAHHCSYDNLGNEQFNKDVIILHPFVHRYIFHYLLSGGIRKPGQQKNYPNKAQEIARCICVTSWLSRLTILSSLIAIAVGFTPAVTDLIRSDYNSPVVGYVWHFAIPYISLFLSFLLCYVEIRTNSHPKGKH
ncbi:MAG: hypothetical protein F6K55_03285 [Moorea sp. SIO4A3]|nr:hypothetical protein [Moorena sp. SIO4A3]